MKVVIGRKRWWGLVVGEGLVGLDPEGKFTQAFPLKKKDVSIQVSGPHARDQVIQSFENPYSYDECTREHQRPPYE